MAFDLGYFDREQSREIQALMYQGYDYNTAKRMAAGFIVIDEVKKEEKKMIKKFYRVIKENPLWAVGAILQWDGSNNYKPVDGNDIWDMVKHTEVQTVAVVEHSPDYFERVYAVNLLTKTVYKVKAEAMELINKDYTEK